jgi:UDP-2-acetamido-3-amino-2,3-dideoxy-glucuronate N-acetyltransferase
VKHMLNYFVHESSYVGSNVKIGNGTKVWHFCHIQGSRPGDRDTSVGENCVLGQNVYVGSGVRIGSGCKIQNNVSVYDGVELEDYVFCGPSCVFTNDLTPRARYPKDAEARAKTLVKEGASIGANATIVCGVTVGRYAMVGAGSVVTADVPDFALVLGVPARVVGKVDKEGNRIT